MNRIPFLGGTGGPDLGVRRHGDGMGGNVYASFDDVRCFPSIDGEGRRRKVEALYTLLLF